MHSWEELDKFRGRIVSGEWPTIPELFEIAVEKFGDRNNFTSFRPERITLSFKESLDKILRAASYMAEQGIKKGDRVLLNGKNSIEWAIAYFAALFAGAVLVPIDNQMRTERFIRLSEFADVVFALVDSDVLEKMRTENEEWFNSLKGALILSGTSQGYRNILSVGTEPLKERPKISEYDDAAILFTSGTTGNEKGVILTHRNLSSDVYSAADFIPYINENDIIYALLPLHHSYCCTTVLLESIHFGCECIFGHGIVVSRMINDMKKGKVSVFMGVPLLYNKIMSGVIGKIRRKGILVYLLMTALMGLNGIMGRIFKKSPFNDFFRRKITSKVGLDHARLLISGAGPLSPKITKQYRELGLPFLQGYGLTEASPVVTLNPPEHFKVESIGRALPFIDLIIADRNDEGIGEIRIKGPNVTKGYLKDERGTKELFDENGYLRTGDLASIDEEGYVYLKGRAKNIIVTEGGKNVFPEEIEALFDLYPEVDQVLIRGFHMKKDVPSESVEAVIYPSAECTDGHTEEETKEVIERIIKEVNKILVGYKKIEKLTILKEPMEMTTTKKVKRASVSK